MSLLARLLPQREQRSLPEQRMLSSSAFVPSPTFDGVVDAVGEYRAMQSMAVFACVRILSDVIASMPWYVYRRDQNNVPQRIYPTPGVVRKPCADMDLFQWKWMVVCTLALRGNSYHLVTGRDKNGYPTGLMPIHPDLVWLERRVNILEWYDPIYRVLGERIPREDIIHIRRFTLPGEPWGLSPIRQAARAIGITLHAEEYGYRYFRDSANPSGLLKTGQTMMDDEIEQVQAQWMSSHGGRRFPAVLTGGFEFEPLSITPEESQFLATRNYQVADISRMYGVPPHLIGDQEKATSWGSGIEQMNLGFFAYTLAGWTTCVESTISNFLPRGQFVRFDPSVLLRGDIKTRLEAYNLGRQSGLWNVDEIRAKEELPPVPGGAGKGHLQPLNYGPLGVAPPEPDGPGGAPPAGGPPHPGQEPEPAGIGNGQRSHLQCRLDKSGRVEYFQEEA